MSDGKPWPWSAKEAPQSVRDLVGRPVRIIKEGDVVTQEFIPGRVTVVLTKDSKRIEDIRVEPGPVEA